MQAPDVNKLRLSREEALLGNYAKASELHTSILRQTKKYLAGVGDPRREQKWKQVIDTPLKCEIIKLN
jgi:hypothetical protein